VNKYCDAMIGKQILCPHPDECAIDCQFNNAVVTRTIKPYPAVVLDEVDANEQWQSIGEMLAVAVWAAALVIITLFVFSCLFLWGKLV